MHKAILIFTCFIMLTGLLALPVYINAYQGASATPTAPPPPMATKTSPPPTNTHLPPPRPTNTATRYVPPGSRASKTPTVTLTPVYTNTQTSTSAPTLAATATLTPTLTLISSPTPFLNLHILVYLDINQNKLFDTGEGVNDLLLFASSGSWSAKVILQSGQVRLALPPDLTPGSDVQIQAPYLHWSEILRAPKPGSILESSLRLDLPQYPVSLP